MEEKSQEVLTFYIEKQRFAIDINNIDRIIRAVAITKLTDAPSFIEGVIDYYGEIIVVINLRKRLGYSIEELKLSDRFVIVKTSNKKLALIVDEVEKLLTPNSKDVYKAKDLDAGMQFIKVVREDDGIIFIYDLEKLLNKEDEIKLDKFIEANSISIATL